MSETHSLYSGSMIYRVPLCPGSARLAARAPKQISSIYADEGTRAHTWLAARLTNDASVVQPMLSADMLQAVQEAVDYVDDLRKQFPDLVVLCEQRVYFPQSVVDAEDCSGTADILCFSATADRAWVIDFKGGVGETIAIEDNAQVRFYATGALWDQKAGTVTLVILQPRSYVGNGAPREQDVTLYDLVEFQADTEDAIRAAEQPDAPLIPGEAQCHWCPAGVICEAREKAALAVMTENPVAVMDFDRNLLPDPAALDMARVGYLLRMKDFVVDWFKDIEKVAYQRAREGIFVPGRKLVYSQARRRFDASIPKEQIAEELSALTGYTVSRDDFFPRALLGITETETLVLNAVKAYAEPEFRKQAIEDTKAALAKLMVKDTSGNTTLVSDTDPRPPVQTGDDFAGVVPTPIMPNAAAPVPRGGPIPLMPTTPFAPALAGPPGQALERPANLIPGVTMPFGEDNEYI